MGTQRSFPAIVAHRGYWVQHPENTLPAYLAAEHLGVDMIELDVHETKDGEFIMFHDPTHPSAPRTWRKMDYAEIRASVGEVLAPRLVDVLRALPNMPLNIEIKSIRHPSKLLAVLRENPPAPGSFLSSFHLIDLKTLRRLHCPWPLYLITMLPPKGLQRFFTQIVYWLRLYRFTPRFLAGVSLHYPLVSRRLIRIMHHKGFKVHSWTVNNPKKMHKFIDYGIDGIISNVPDTLLAIKKNYRGET